MVRAGRVVTINGQEAQTSVAPKESRRACTFTYGMAEHMSNKYDVPTQDKVFAVELPDYKGEHADMLGVFDGHGEFGDQAAVYVATELAAEISSRFISQQAPKRVLHDSIGEVNDKMFDNGAEDRFANSGTTAVVILIIGQRFWVANIGDSRAVVGMPKRGVYGIEGGELTTKTVGNIRSARMSTDHKVKLPSEAERLQRLAVENGQDRSRPIVKNDRLAGQLELARAFGSFTCFAPLRPEQACEPSITGPFTVVGRDVTVVLASDGVWDVMADHAVLQNVMDNERIQVAAQAVIDEAVKVRTYLHMPSQPLCVESLALVGDRFAHTHCLPRCPPQSGSDDDATTVVIRFKPPKVSIFAMLSGGCFKGSSARKVHSDADEDAEQEEMEQVSAGASRRTMITAVGPASPEETVCEKPAAAARASMIAAPIGEDITECEDEELEVDG